MEFEDQDEEHEEEEDEEEEDAIPITSYNPLKMSNQQTPVTDQTRSSSSSSPPPSPLSLSIPPVKKPAGRYRECLKNHAVGIGGHAVDGCGEFMPAGVEGTIDALKCAACNCHRNFHRKEADPTEHHQNQQIVSPIAYYPHFQFQSFNSRTSPTGYPTQSPLALPSSQEREMMTSISNPMAEMALGNSSGKKRFRTKFSSEQKEKMLELAEKIGWRFQKQDDEVIQQFCQENGMKRKVLKVWMHNNKQHYLGKKP